MERPTKTRYIARYSGSFIDRSMFRFELAVYFPHPFDVVACHRFRAVSGYDIFWTSESRTGSWKVFESISIDFANGKMEEFGELDRDEMRQIIFDKIDKAMDKVLQFEQKVLTAWEE